MLQRREVSEERFGVDVESRVWADGEKAIDSCRVARESEIW